MELTGISLDYDDFTQSRGEYTNEKSIDFVATFMESGADNCVANTGGDMWVLEAFLTAVDGIDGTIPAGEIADGLKYPLVDEATGVTIFPG